MTILRQPWRWMPFGFRLRLARLRSRAGQHRLARRLILVGVVVLSATVLVGARAQASAVQKTWGETVEVLVVTSDVSAGDELAGRAEFEPRPVAFVPADAVLLSDSGLSDTVAGPIADDHAVRSLLPGDIVTSRDLASSGHAMPLEPGQRAVSLPRGPGVPALRVGDRVELVVVFDAFGQPEDTPNTIESVIVVDVTEDDVTVAVMASDVATLAKASTSGQVVVARR